MIGIMDERMGLNEAFVEIKESEYLDREERRWDEKQKGRLGRENLKERGPNGRQAVGN